MAATRALPRLEGVYARIHTRARRRRRAGRAGVWEGLRRALNPASFRPRLRPEVEVRELARRPGKRRRIIQTARRPNALRLTDDEPFLLELMDGSRTVKEIVVERFQRFETFSLSAVADLVDELRRGDFLEEPYFPVADRAMEVLARRRQLPPWPLAGVGQRLRALARAERRAADKRRCEEAVALFRAVPLTRELPEEILAGIAEHVTLLRLRAGRTVVRQGDRAEQISVVRSGTLEVVGTEEDGSARTIRRLGPGRSFGEVGLLVGRARATVRAIEPSEVFVADKGAVGRALARRADVVEELRRGLAAVAELLRLPPFRALDEADAARVLGGARWRSLSRGDRVVEQGAEARSFCVVASGEVEVIEDRRRVGRLGPGASFGELALVVVDSVWSATARAATPARVLEIDRDAFDRVLAKSFRDARLAPSWRARP